MAATRRCSPTRGAAAPTATPATPSALRRGDRRARSALPPSVAAAGLRGPARRAARRGAPARRASSRSTPTLDDAGRARAAASRRSTRGRRRRRPAGCCRCTRPTGRRRAGHEPAWPLRRGRLSCCPGDSPLGLRLPLDSLAVAADPESPTARAVDRSTPRRAAAPTAAAGTSPPAPRSSTRRGRPTTALCVEARDGHCTSSCRRSSELERLRRRCSRAIEARRASVGVPGRARGLPAAARPAAARSSSVTPDPGVIEVNVQPAGDAGRELVDAHRPTLYDDGPRSAAWPPRSSMLDGTPHRHRRRQPHDARRRRRRRTARCCAGPTCCAACITYWQHHPSLSYLFSGLFVGPTSQAPRVDEARARRALRARDRVRRARPQRRRRAIAPPWLVDRLLRHLLDRPHRQHPPRRVLHRQAVQPGLASAAGSACSSCAASRCRRTRGWRWCRRCWCARSSRASGDEPYAGAAGALGHRAARPVPAAALRRGRLRATSSPTCARTAIAFDAGWLDPFLEFRFPRSARSTSTASTLELRAGDRAVARARRGGRRRRHRALRRLVGRAAAGQGRRARPPAATWSPATACRCRCTRPATPGEYVAGVRYRAWQPPSALHPTIGVHAPLCSTSSTVDAAASLGGCTYHVVHPGRPRLRHVPGQRERGRGPPRRAGSSRSATRPGRSTSAALEREAAAGAGRRRSTRARSTCGGAPPRRLTAIDRPQATVLRLRRRTGPGARRACRDDDARRPTARVREHWSARRPRARASLGLDELPRRRDEARAAARRRRRHLQRLRRRRAGAAVQRVGARPAAAAARRATSGPASRPGVVQRAELLDAVLADLYGAAPAAAPRAAPAGAGARPPRVPARRATGIRLARRAASCSLAAVDLAATPTGRWRVLGRPHPGAVRARATRWRTGAWSRGCCPSSTATPQVHRLAPFFQALRVGAAATSRPPASRTRGSSCSAPGPLSETAFDQAFLASLLGFPLVEGSDLTVRDGRVWMRVARPARAGRRHPAPGRRDWYCDPLELRPDSQLGVPGLSRRPGRARVGRQHARHRRAGEPGAAAVPAASCAQALLGEHAAAAVGRRPGGAATRRRARTCSPTSTTRAEADQPRARVAVASAGS